MSLEGKANLIGVDGVPCSAGVLGTSSGQLVITPTVFGPIVGVLCLSLGVVSTTIRHFGYTTGVLDTLVAVLGTTSG